MKKSSELGRAEKLAAPVAVAVAGLGGFALEVCYGNPISEGVVSGLLAGAIFGSAAYFLPRLEEGGDSDTSTA